MPKHLSKKLTQMNVKMKNGEIYPLYDLKNAKSIKGKIIFTEKSGKKLEIPENDINSVYLVI